MYRLASTLEVFAVEFGDSFEGYIKKVLNSLQKAITILDSKKMEKTSTGKSCDFLVETKDTIILIECKACSFTANRLTDTVIENNNSTGKVSKGLVQLYTTAKDLENGRFDKFGIDHSKTTIGIVVTFGEIPSANSEWYFEEFFLKRADKKLNEAIYPSKQMTRRPIVIDVSGFERLIITLNSDTKTLQDMYDKKQSEGYHATGEWGIWLASLHDSEHLELLPFMQDAKIDFLEDLGISSNISEIKADQEKELHITTVATIPNKSPI